MDRSLILFCLHLCFLFIATHQTLLKEEKRDLTFKGSYLHKYLHADVYIYTCRFRSLLI